MTESESGYEDPSDISGRAQDPFVARHKPTPQHAPERTLVLNGLLGDSERAGHRRLYFNTRLDYYAEFATDDVLATESVPAEQAPFAGLEATRVTLRRTAQISFTHVRSAEPVDQFDLDVRLGVSGWPTPRRPPNTAADECQHGPTWANCPSDVGCPSRDVCPTDLPCPTDNDDCPSGYTECRPRTCHTCRTDCGTCQTCVTCNTCYCPGGQLPARTLQCPTRFTCAPACA